MKLKQAYWLSTSVVAVLLILSAYSYLFHEKTIEGLQDLGFPDFFRYQLAVLKILAAVVLLTPQINTRLKEWAYAGVGLFLLTALIAHLAHGDPAVFSLLLLALFVVLAISNACMQKLSGP